MEYIPHGTFLKRNVHMMGVHFDPPSLVFQKRPVGEGGGMNPLLPAPPLVFQMEQS